MTSTRSSPDRSHAPSAAGLLAVVLATVVLGTPARAAEPSVDPFAPQSTDPFDDVRGAVVHPTPTLEPGARVRIVVRMGADVPPDANVVLYHRTFGSDRRFVVRQVPRVDDSQAYVTLPALTHRNVGLEYYILVYDAEGTPIAGIGSRMQPRVASVPPEQRPPSSQPDVPARSSSKPTTPGSALPRVFVGLRRSDFASGSTSSSRRSRGSSSSPAPACSGLRRKRTSSRRSWRT